MSPTLSTVWKTALVCLLCVTLVTCQTFQYSKGWTNGRKRAISNFLYPEDGPQLTEPTFKGWAKDTAKLVYNYFDKHPQQLKALVNHMKKTRSLETEEDDQYPEMEPQL